MKIEIIEPKKQKQINFPVTARTLNGTRRVVRFYNETNGIELSFNGVASPNFQLCNFAPVTDETQWEIIPGVFDAKQPDDDGPQWDGKFPVLMKRESNKVITLFLSRYKRLTLFSCGVECLVLEGGDASEFDWQPFPPGTEVRITL